MKKFNKNLFSTMPDIVNKSTVAMLCMVLGGLLSVCRVNAQTYDNTIVNDNSSWATLSYGLGAYNIPCCVETQYIYFEGDTTIVDVPYKKVFSFNDRLHENKKYEGLIREQNKKTYFILANSDKEYLLYDFSLEAGVGFEYRFFGMQEPNFTFYASIVDSVEINNTMKKRIQITVTPNSEWIVDTWVEGIGSLSGILYPCYRAFLSGSEIGLLCYFQNNELIYKNPVYSECYYDKVEDITSVQAIVNNDCNVFPNPVDDILNISCLDNIISRIEIFDNLGRKIYNQTHQGSINVSSFSKGLYLLKVYDANEQVSVFKIIKK